MTIAENEQAAAYARAWTRGLCFLALHFEHSDHAIQACLGTIVRADTRRLEDLRCEIDDVGPNVMLVSRLILAVSDAIL